jgi:hypothetical protein
MADKKAQKRKTLSLESKIEILSAVDRGEKKIDIANRFDIAASSLSTILKSKEQLVAEWEKSGAASSRKRMRLSSHGNLEVALETWFTQQRSLNVPITGPLLAEKARTFAATMGIEDFKASNGFLDRFKKRHGISWRTISGEAEDANMNAAVQWREKVLPNLLQRYSADDVYNADESGLFYKCLPHQTLAYKREKCSGGKKSKKRITLLFCANMSGNDKRKLLFIGNAQRPRCFVNVNTNNLPVVYAGNRKAWMVSELWKNWLTKFDKQMVREKRKILLLVDNVSTHKIPVELKAIELAFLPPNTTSVIQPCDQGIIRAFKMRYRTMLLRRLLLWIEAKKALADFEFTLLDAIHTSARAWQEVESTTISNCFHHAGFEHGLQVEELAPAIPAASDGEIRNIFSFLGEELGLQIDRDVTAADYLEVDEEVLTEEVLSDDDIIQQVLYDGQNAFRNTVMLLLLCISG